MSFMASLWEKGVWYVGTLMLIVNWNVLPVSSHNHEITGKVATLFVPNGKGAQNKLMSWEFYNSFHNISNHIFEAVSKDEQTFIYSLLLFRRTMTSSWLCMITG